MTFALVVMRMKKRMKKRTKKHIRQILSLQVQAATPLDLRTIEDVRGQFIMWRQIHNYEGRDLSGCVFWHCYPTIPNALNINACTTKADLSPLDVGEDLKGIDLTNFNFDNLDLRGFDFYKSDLSRSSFKGAKLEGASFDGALIDGLNIYEFADWHKATGDMFKNANFNIDFVTGETFVKGLYKCAFCQSISLGEDHIIGLDDDHVMAFCDQCGMVCEDCGQAFLNENAQFHTCSMV